MNALLIILTALFSVLFVFNEGNVENNRVHGCGDGVSSYYNNIDMSCHAQADWHNTTKQ